MQGKLATPGAQKVGGLKAYQVSAEVLSSRSREGGRGGIAAEQEGVLWFFFSSALNAATSRESDRDGVLLHSASPHSRAAMTREEGGRREREERQ